MLALLLPAVSYWTWRAARLDEQAQAVALSSMAALITLGVLCLLVFRRRGLALRPAVGMLGMALLGWIMGIASWGGESKPALLLPFMGVVTVALVAGLMAACRALTDTRLALAKVQQTLLRAPEASEGQLGNLFIKAFELSPLSMSLSRASDGVFLALNAASRDIQGYQPEELLGRSALELGTWEHAAERREFLQQVRQHHGRFETEKRLRRNDGSWMDCRVWATLVEVDGQACLLCAALDITKQKQRESLLLDLAEGLASPMGEPFLRSAARYLTTVLKADLVMIAELGADARLATLALWKDQLQVPNISFESAQAPFTAMLGSAELVELSAPDGLPCPDCAGWPKDPDDLYRSCAGLALRDAAGTPIGLFWAAWRTTTTPTKEQSSLLKIVANRSTAELIRLRRDREIFQLKDSLENRVQARTAQLRATNAELESFAYSVSHDLQSPLRSIQGFLFLLERRLTPRLSTEEDRLIGRINANILRMHELINDLLALARVSRGNLTRESVNLSRMAELVLRDLEGAFPDRQLRIDIASDLHAQCDAKLALIVLENLLGNAFKYTRKAKKAHIEFGVLAAESGSPSTFFVRDNGAGFNMDYADSLFKPFHRLHHEDEYEGSGIGLATVHRILERHGGSIRAEAVEGRGATFYFTFEGELSPAES